MYAILDIEATGGKVGEESIIEIAIYRFDGEEIVDQFISLVNPEKKIDPFVQKLTNISDKMVKTAPKFHEVAKRIVEITDDCILVGHNVTFDYRMLVQEFNRLGYQFEKEWIDTFEYAEKLIPNMPSYSLGKLCNSLGIVLTDRHRASGDARATITLFKMLLDKDDQKIITIKSGLKFPKKVNVKYEKFLKELPNKPGLFYFYNSKKQCIYIGKSINIHQAVNHIFTSKSIRHNRLKRYARDVKFELTGSNLLASIKEINEIIKLKPYLNQEVATKPLYTYGIYFKENKNTFSRIEIGKGRRAEPFLAFKTREEAEHNLEKIIINFQLCQNVNNAVKDKKSCFGYSVDLCLGACVGHESRNEYNQRLKDLVHNTQYPAENFLIVSKGREGIEKSFIYIENSIFMGYGYYEFHHQINSKERIKKIITEVAELPDIRAIIRNYLFKANKNQIIIIE